MLIDLHAKTQLSNEVSLTADQVLRRAQAAGLDGVAFCETMETARCPEVLELAQRDYPELNVFVGVEVPTDRGILLGFAPRIDDFYLNEEWAWLSHRTTPSATSVIDVFSEQGGVVLAARPYDLEIPFNMGDYIFEIDGLDGVQVYTSRVQDIQQNFALEAATFMGLNTFGGSDPSSDASVIGDYATFFEEDITSQKRLVDTMRDAEFWAVRMADAKGGRRKNNGRRRRR